MIDLSKYRIIDISDEVTPGIYDEKGEYTHPKGTWSARRWELRRWIYAEDKAIMHWVDTETHIGTHVEGPLHYDRNGKAPCEIPVETYIGECCVCDFSDMPPKNGRKQPIMPKDLERKGVRKDDIVLLWSGLPPEEAPFISPEAAEWMRELPVKQMGISGIGLEAPIGEGYPYKPTPGYPCSMVTHIQLLGNNIPIIEGITNLDMIRKSRVFYIGLPLMTRGMDSSWIRAIVLEEK